MGPKPNKQKAQTTPAGSDSTDEEIAKFLSSRSTPKERMTIEPVVVKMNRIKPINVNDERLL
jgi:hypothetical protein